MFVYLLRHVRELSDDADEVKHIGVYATAEDAEAARLRVLPQPGFRDHPDGFEVTPCEVGKDHWTEGFVTWAEADATAAIEDAGPSD